MIPVKERITEEGSLPGKEVYATIGDPRMVMKSLTKLYSNTSLATIREYSTNARDANVEAGRSDVPVEVTLPTTLSPYFVVKDSGSGLSEEELEKVYISYGTSTKRDSNLFNGYLGYGSKSALSYTNTFTITSVKNGIRTIAVITRKPDYSVVLKVVSTSKSSEPNGVTIKVPVQDPQTFSRIAMDFYRFWTPGTILVDGKETEQAVGDKIDDNLFYSKTEGTSYVVMGNVGYRIANPEALFTNKKMKAISFVAFVENGSVEFTPSREDLEYSDATKATLNNVIETFEKKMVKAAKEEIAKAKDYFDAYSSWVEWSNRLGQGIFEEITYGGNKFETDIKLTAQGEEYEVNSWRRYNTSSVYKSISVHNVNTRGFIVSDMDASKLHSNHKAKAKEYLKLKGIQATHVFFLWEPVNNPWVRPERIISWKDLLAAIPRKAKATTGGTGRIPGSFDYQDETGKWHFGQALPSEGTAFWLGVQEAKGINTYTLLAHHRKEKTKGFKGKVSVIHLSANREAKFKRENPDIKNFKEFCEGFLELEGQKLLSDEAKMVLDISHSGGFWTAVIERFQDDRIIDPEWKKFAQSIANKDTLMVDYLRSQSYAGACGRRYGWKAYRPVGAGYFPFAERYPLIAKFGYDFPSNELEEDFIWYMNACYQNRVKNV